MGSTSVAPAAAAGDQQRDRQAATWPRARACDARAERASAAS